MKRIAVLALSMLAALSVLAVSASAAPAPKTTGGLGFSYGGVQRSVSFAAIQSSTDTCGVFWNVSTVSQLTFRLTGDTTDYTHHVSLTQNGTTVGGEGGYPVTGGDVYHWNVTTGSISVNTLSLTVLYDLGATGTVMHITGTIASDGSISGTWDDNFGGARTGTFTAPAHSATPIVSYCGKGTFYYTDSNGSWYFGVVKTVSVSGNTAWFATQIVASNLGFESLSTNYLFTKVTDVGEPGIGHDLLGVENLMTPDAATSAVAGHLNTSLGDVTINRGNIQVH
jgi:hypothetical protein